MNQNKPAVVKKLQERFRNVSVGRGLYMAFMMPTMLSMFSTRAFAADTIWTKASAIMQDVYTQILSTMRVQVLGTVSNGYQIINRADVGGQYLNEWQTAKTTWVTTVRRFNTTPLPKTGY